MTDPAALVAALAERQETIAAAESLTGGLLLAALVDVPGASDVVAGGLVAYTRHAKASVLGVDEALLDERGTVDPEVAVQMAQRARAMFVSDWALSTTGVAGPGPHEGHRAGTAYVGLVGPGMTRSWALALDGDRSAVRAGTVHAALDGLGDALSR